MALSLRPSQDADRGSDRFFHTNNPHFFKVILPCDIGGGDVNLRIPPKFVRTHGASLSSDLVSLMVPSGSLWKVKLCRDEHGGLLFQEGWAAFMRRYNIRPGHFLVFRHESGSSFRVLIFDKTACEIAYPIGPDQDRDNGDELLPRTSLVDGPVVSGPERPLVLRSQESAKAPNGRITEGEAEDHLNSCYKSHSLGAKVATRSGALLRASSFQYKGPSFLVIVQPTLVHPKFLLRLPNKFQETFSLKLSPSGEMRLMVSGNTTWTVRYVNRDKCSSRGTGWKEFVVDNNLEVGDVCVFELLTGQIGITFLVTIFHSKGVLSLSN